MATVRLSDVQFDPDVYLSYLQEDRTDKNAYIASGVATTNSQLQSRASGEGDVTTIPYWNDLDIDSENISSDDPDEYATPDKITTDKMTAARVHINNAWQTANLVSSVMGSEDPMRQIASRTNAYWQNRFAARVQATTLGIYLDNAAGSGDMIFGVAVEDDNNVTDATRFSYEGFIDAHATMGESSSELGLLGIHPKTMAQLRKQNQIEFIQDKDTGIMIPTYNGLRVVEDKKLPVIAGSTSGNKYVSVLYRQGVIGYGEGTPKRPVATEFDELAGNGAGVETLVERKQWIIHPEGYSFDPSAAGADGGPTVAEVGAASAWTRKFQRENIGMAFFVHN
ncbi:MAG: hypothetical protein ACPHUL_00015 [Marinomonas gallaica]